MKKLNDDELKELVDVYAFNKSELDNQKNLCDKLNKDIKDAMASLDVDKLEGTDVVANLVIQNREAIDEDKLLDILKANWYETHGSMDCPYIKTRYYVDMDELEKAIYHGDLDKDTLIKLDTCKSVTKVKTLRINKKKGD